MLFRSLINIEHFDFSMCNPPFFDIDEAHEGNPHTALGGTPLEMCTDGGEEAFVLRMAKESSNLKDRWVVFMLGIHELGHLPTLVNHDSIGLSGLQQWSERSKH